jgi:hypothetical protein
MSHPEFDPGASSWLYFDKWLIARDAAEQSRKAGLNLAAQLSKVKAELVLAQRAHNSAARGRKQAEAELAALKEAAEKLAEVVMASASWMPGARAAALEVQRLVAGAARETP